MKEPTPLGFHGLTVRARDPEALAETWRALLGWEVLRRRRGVIVLGAGPELFVEIRLPSRGKPEGVEEVHLAVKNLDRSRRRSRPDRLGGDSWTRPLTDLVSLTVREFRRAPAPQWRKRRRKV
ncbi:MAG: VOC family protein [Acidobacteriota bacterium]